MFNVYKRKSSSATGRQNPVYYANLRIALPNGTTVRERITTKCTDRRAAEEFARAYEARRFAELVRGETHAAAPTTPRTLADALTLMSAHLASQRAAGQLAAATVAFYRLHLGHFLRLWGDALPLAEITTGRARAYYQTRLTEPGLRAGQTVSSHTITKELGALRIALKLAHEHGWYPHDPRAIVPAGITSGYTSRDRVLTPAELDALKEHLAPHRWAVVAFACATGAEASALERAAHGDLDLARGVVLVRGSKNERRENRTVPVVLPLARKLLRAVEKIVGTAEDARALFAYWHNRNRDVRLACKAAGLAPCSPNDWRRTFATWHADAGISLDTLKHAMGHSTSKMLERVYDKPGQANIAARMKREMKGTKK